MISYTLGLDIGSHSIGWAIINIGKKPSILDVGVRVFPEGVDRDTKGLEKSKNATRREARGARRVHQRRNLRRNQLVKALQSTGLLPKDKKKLKELLKKEPYPLRAKGLDEKLELYEFGRVLFHINQRRGFKSNRKTGEVNEKSKIAKGDKKHRGANELQRAVEGDNFRTIGEYFANIEPEKQRIRGQYTFRSMYQKEFDLLWKKQSEYYPDILTEELRKKIKDEIIFYQRPLKPTEELIGECDLEPGEKRCPRGDWYARRFRILQDVNNLIIQNPDGSEQKLTGDQREKLFSELFTKKEIKFDKTRKLLGLVENQRFNLEQDGKVKSLKGDEFVAAMRSRNLFGAKKWDAMNGQEKISLNTACLELEDDELFEKMIAVYGFTEEQAERVLKITFPRGYMSFSLKAIQKLIPYMERGMLTSESLDVAYPDRNKKSIEEKDKLDLPEDLRNPIVNKALFEVRKVVNAIIREYDKPQKIKIEMARDVKGTKRQREELQKKMRENEKTNKEAIEWIKENTSIKNPHRDDILKYKLWIECNKTCPYTGKTINKVDLFEEPVFQIEHILPYDRSLDDSYMNKTLCEVHENKDVKKNQTPFEAYSHDAQKYEQILQRVNSSKMPDGKRKRFWQDKLELEHSIRELNDTRYITREVIRYLKQLGVNVQGTRGKMTGGLRYQWGLDGIFTDLGVRRDDDHRRHAVDAVVVAVTEQKHLRELARSKYSLEGIKFSLPWPHFREELAEKVKHVSVSHKPRRKVSGALHEETNYGPTGLKDEKGQEYFVYRKKLEDLTIPMVGKIVDAVVRGIVEKRLSEKGISLNKGDRIPKEVWTEPLYMKCKRSDKKVPIKKVRIREVFGGMIVLEDKQGKPYRAVASGNNHHVEIFEYTDQFNKSGKAKRDSKVISFFEAIQRSRQRKPVVEREHGANTKFVCSLAINDMVMMPDQKGNMDLFRVQKMNVNKQIYFRHHTAATIDDESTLIRKQANLFDGYKVSVDPLGRIHQEND